MTQVQFPFDTKELFEKYVQLDDLPKNDFKKQAILLILLDEFEDDRVYQEPEVNKIIKKYFSDVATIRREFINFNYIRRDPYKGTYWVNKRTLTLEDIQNNTMLSRHAKDYIKID